jgi:hypothetical protein
VFPDEALLELPLPAPESLPEELAPEPLLDVPPLADPPEDALPVLPEDDTLPDEPADDVDDVPPELPLDDVPPEDVLPDELPLAELPESTPLEPPSLGPAPDPLLLEEASAPASAVHAAALPVDVIGWQLEAPPEPARPCVTYVTPQHAILSMGISHASPTS